VPTQERPARLLRFGDFEADLRSRELRKQGVKIKLGEQPFAVLAVLLAQPGELVTRDELRQRLWSVNTFVDFDVGLNKAINRLRDALDDSAEKPRFVETLPKRGYRFIASLQRAANAVVVEPQPVAEPLDAGARPAVRQRALLAATAAAVIGVLAVAVVWWLEPEESAGGSNEPLIRSSLLPPAGKAFVSYSIALSRDGSHLAFVAEGENGSQSLWIRALESTTATSIAGTDGASLPFWSPDGRQVAFFADQLLKVVDLAGGAVRAIADVRRPSGGSWNGDDVIIYAPDVNGPLYRVAAAGGTPTEATFVAGGEAIRGHRWPVFLPDDRQFLFVALSAAAPSDNAPELRVGSLDTLESSRIDWDGGRSVAFALDHLLFVRGGMLYAQPFASSERRLSGPPAPIAAVDLASTPAFYRSALAVSVNGVLVFQSSADMPAESVWLDEQGREQRTLSAIAYTTPAISPDGRSLAGSCEGPRTGTLSICVADLERGVSVRITDGPNDRYPVWSHDGREVAYLTGSGIYRARADGSGSPQLVSERGIPTDWVADGRILSFGSQHGVVQLALSSPDTNEVTELGTGAEGQISPDGAWLAFVDREGLLVERFPAASTRVTVAAAPAAQPRWSRDGRTLFYISGDKKLMAAAFDPATGSSGTPRLLAQTGIVGAGLIGLQYDVAPDGRFIMNVIRSDAAPLTLLDGWTSRVPR
jgi:DNA-binding winged helix-turn-helix (wHTH) protein/Tol biopolymer transport system component